MALLFAPCARVVEFLSTGQAVGKATAPCTRRYCIYPILLGRKIDPYDNTQVRYILKLEGYRHSVCRVFSWWGFPYMRTLFVFLLLTSGALSAATLSLNDRRFFSSSTAGLRI